MDPYLFIGQNFTCFYFLSFVVIFPLLGFFEDLMYNVYKKK